MDNANPVVQRMVRHQIRPYPGDSALQDNYQNKVEWFEYKRHVVKECVKQRLVQLYKK